MVGEVIQPHSEIGEIYLVDCAHETPWTTGSDSKSKMKMRYPVEHLRELRNITQEKRILNYSATK